MPDEPPPPAADAAADRLKLDQRRLALDESWPRKWGTVILGAAATAVAASISAGVNMMQLQNNKLSAQIASDDRHKEQDRAVLEMFFKYVDEKPNTSEERINKLNSLKKLAYDSRLFDLLQDEVVRSAGEVQKTPSDVLAGSVGSPGVTIGKSYSASDFTGYIQYFTGRADQADTVAKALSAMGMRVPGQQKMDAAHSPGNNEIRIYREGQRSYAQELAGKLEQQTGLKFRVVGPLPGALPDGVLEIWLGKS